LILTGQIVLGKSVDHSANAAGVVQFIEMDGVVGVHIGVAG
jgi:hypothetical protein